MPPSLQRAPTLPALSADAQAVEDLLLGHLGYVFPFERELLGDARSRVLVRVGMQRAASCSLKTVDAVCRYLDLTVILGVGFDHDPWLPWAENALAAVLKKARPLKDLLDRPLAAYLERVSGPKGERGTRALLRARKLTFDDAVAVAGKPARLAELLGALYPEKFATRDDPRPFLRLAEASAARWGLDATDATAVYTGLMFLLGRDFDQDPLYPWAAEALANRATDDSSERGRALLAAAMAYLDRVLALRRSRGRGC